MEVNKINYQVIEECMLAAESKEYLEAVFQASTGGLDSELACLSSENLPACLKALPSTLQISSEKAQVLVWSLHNLMKEYIGSGAMLDENILAMKFPAGFKKQLKVFLFKMLRERAPACKRYFQDEFSSGLQKLRDFDWRLDLKISSKSQERVKQPVLYVEMDLEEQQQVLFQVSKGQLKEILNNFETINQQLSALTQQQK